MALTRKNRWKKVARGCLGKKSEGGGCRAAPGTPCDQGRISHPSLTPSCLFPLKISVLSPPWGPAVQILGRALTQALLKWKVSISRVASMSSQFPKIKGWVILPRREQTTVWPDTRVNPVILGCLRRDTDPCSSPGTVQPRMFGRKVSKGIKGLIPFLCLHSLLPPSLIRALRKS